MFKKDIYSSCRLFFQGKTMHLHLLLIAIFTNALFAAAAEITVAEAEGFSPERLHKLHVALHAEVDNKKLAGTVTLLAKNNKLIEIDAYGHQDLATKTAMKKDTIFRIFSMTKPITATAMMILYEEGKWLPSDPIEKHIPELKNVMVCVGKNKDGSLMLEKPQHAPTMSELMTHTAGFALGFLHSPVNELYKKADLFNAPDFNNFINRVAALPLDYHPGTQWEYSISSDIQGYLVERLSGVPFEQFLQERIFKPLNMNDTSFSVPTTKRARLATTYQPDQNDVLQPMWNDEKESTTTMPSGGGGLFSTAEDYWHFAQMLLNEGTFNGKKILAPSTVKLMSTNHLSQKLRNGNFGIGPYVMQPGLGFGYSMGVMDEPLKLNKTLGDGTYFWIGAAGTWFWIDPTNQLIFIGLSQRWMLAPGMPNLEDMSQALVYQAYTRIP